MSAQCPHSMELVAQKAKIESLEKEIENLKACRNSKILEPAKQINRLAEIAKVNADFLYRTKREGRFHQSHTYDSNINRLRSHHSCIAGSQ